MRLWFMALIVGAAMLVAAACGFYEEGGGSGESEAVDGDADGDADGNPGGDVDTDAEADQTDRAQDVQDGGDVDAAGEGPAGPCVCPGEDCAASDDMPCNGGSGLCGDGTCHPTGALETITAHGEGFWPSSVSLSSDGAWLAVSSEEVLAGETGARGVYVSSLRSDESWQPEGVREAVFHPVDADVWAVVVDGAVEVRTLDGELRLRVDDAHGPLAFSPDGTVLAVADADGIRLIPLDDASTEEVRLDHPEDREARMWLLAFSPDGDRVAAGRGASGFGSPVGDVRVFDSATGEREYLFDCPAASGGFSGDGGMLAVACWNFTALYDLTTGTATVLPAPELAQGARYLASEGGETRLLLGSFLGLVRVLRPRDGAWVTEAAVELPAVRDVLELPDGSLVLVPWADLSVHRWTPASRL